MPRGIVERRIHQDDVGAVGVKSDGGERGGGGRHIQHDGIGRDRIGGGIFARQRRQTGIDLDQHELDPGDAPGDREAGGADAGAEFNHAIVRTSRRRGRQQHGVMAGAVARSRLAQAQLPAEKCILGEFVSADFWQLGSVIGPQFVGEPGIAEDLPRLAVIVLMHQNTARQHAERAFDDAHVLVQHQMVDIGAVEQRSDRRNQHDIVGSNQFPQLWRSFADPLRVPGRVSTATCALPALAALPAHFLLL